MREIVGQTGAGKSTSTAKVGSGGNNAGQTRAVGVACPGEEAAPPEASVSKPPQAEEAAGDDDARFQLEPRGDLRAEATSVLYLLLHAQKNAYCEVCQESVSLREQDPVASSSPSRRSATLSLWVM